MPETISVSIIIPNYNHAQFLEKRIESVLSQNYQDFEIIIMDDCSLDKSITVINAYKDHPKVSSIFINNANSGSPFGLWSKGLELATGKYIWIAESDDWCEPGFLETLVPMLENSVAILAHCKSYNSHGNDSSLNPWWDSFGRSFWDSDYIKTGSELLAYYGRYKCPVMNVSSALIKREAISESIIPIDFKYCGDWWFWAQLFMKGEVAFCSTPLNYIRVHKESAIRKKSNTSLIRLKENVAVIHKINTLLMTRLDYSKNYDWVLKLWLDEMFSTQNYFNVSYLSPKLPLKFKLVLWKMYFTYIIDFLLVKLKLKKQ
jgi:glycosyltransferase involved in cell wall biosynthesis